MLDRVANVTSVADGILRRELRERPFDGPQQDLRGIIDPCPVDSGGEVRIADVTLSGDDALDDILQFSPAALTARPVDPAEAECQVARRSGATTHRASQLFAECLRDAVKGLWSKIYRIAGPVRARPYRGIGACEDDALCARAFRGHEQRGRSKRIHPYGVDGIGMASIGKPGREMNDCARLYCGNRCFDRDAVPDVADDVGAWISIECEHFETRVARVERAATGP